MNPISDLSDIARYIDHTQPDLMISDSIFATTWITSDPYIIGSIVPEESDLASLRIIGAICAQIHRTSQCITIELIVTDLLIVGLELAIEFEDNDRRIGIWNSWNN